MKPAQWQKHLNLDPASPRGFRAIEYLGQAKFITTYRFTGQILIDDIPITTITRTSLRSSILSIPQETLTLPGTFRFNADPLNATLSSGSEFGSTDDKSHDELIISDLRKIGLWEIIDPRGGLDGEMTSQSLSRGQAQLFAIARTTIRKDIANGHLVGAQAHPNNPATSINPARPLLAHRILLMDEATSNLDAETDTKIQALIRQEFHDFTIVTVAHRMGSIVDSDVVAMMENGRMVLLGHPVRLIYYLLFSAAAALLLYRQRRAKMRLEHDFGNSSMPKRTCGLSSVLCPQPGDLRVRVHNSL